MARSSPSSHIFAHSEHLHFTAAVLAGEVNLGERLSPYHAGDMLIPLALLWEGVQNSVETIMQTHKWGIEGAIEREARAFQEQYTESLGDQISRYRQQWLTIGANNYNENHIPVLTYQRSLFGEPTNPFQYIAFQWPEGMLGKYIELVLARILNGTVIDLNGILPDIAVQTTEGMVYIESKAARFSSREKYLAPSGAMRPVSRNGFFAKRNQIHTALTTEANSPTSTTYMALVDYDLIGGENMTFKEFVKGHPFVEWKAKTFGKIQDHHDLKSLPERLREAVVIKSILLIPTWAAFMSWNANIIRTVPRTTFQQGRHYQYESHPVAQYFETKHIQQMIEYLTEMKTPKNTHIVSWVQETPIRIETYGHTFLPFESITL